MLQLQCDNTIGPGTGKELIWLSEFLIHGVCELYPEHYDQSTSEFQA